GAGELRHRSGALHRPRLRHGRGAPGHAALRRHRPARVLRERRALPAAIQLRRWAERTAMKFSENWLREWVDPGVDRETLCRRLDMIGLEVESVDELGAGLEHVVVAQILGAERHPDADRLQVCQVDTGSGTVQIVCGAPNARPGLKAPLAQIGARLPNGTAIKAARLRGVESQGMLCSARELGLDQDASGLMELPADAPVGRPLAQYLGLPDASIELGLTPNRADCLSLRGVARDVAASFGAPLRAP